MKTKISARAKLMPAAAGLLLLAAGPAAAGDTHACDYLDKSEVAQVIGMKVDKVESQPANPMGQSICFFDIEAGMSVRFAQLQMMRTGWAKRGGPAFEAGTLFANNMSFLENLQQVEGLGEKAYWGGSGLKLGAGLHVLYQDSYFTVQAATGDPEANLQKSRELAELVIGKIK